MIGSFGDATTEDLFDGRQSARVRRIPPDVQRAALNKLDMLAAPPTLGDLASPPGNRLEALSGELRGRYSIRVNAQWRIVFRWDGDSAYEIALMDYH